MKTRYYHILDKNDNIIYVGLTTTTIGQRFCRHIITKKLNRIDYRCVQIDEIDNGKITSLEDYYREKKRSGELERYYIKKARDEGANLLNISIGGEWNGHILTKILKKDFFDKYGTYDGYLEYKKEYEKNRRMKRKYENKLKNWYNYKTMNPYYKKLHNWVDYHTRPKYKVFVFRWYNHHSKSKFEKFMKRWYNHHTVNKYKQFIRHWFGHRTENRYRKFWEYRVHRKTRNRYHHKWLRLIIRRTYETKQKLLKEQGLLVKKVKPVNKFRELLYNWKKRNSMNPYKKFLFSWMHRRIKQSKKLNLTNLPQNNDK